MNLLLNLQKQKIGQPLSSQAILKGILLFFIALGVFLRCVQYFLDRSLWIDEAFISLNILNKSYAEFLQPLDFNQIAPFGFLVIQKAIVQGFGSSEYALRLFPLLSGILSLFLFSVIAKSLSNFSVAAIAMGLFALCDRLIYYSAEVKQYSSDVLITLLFYWLVLAMQAKALNRLKMLAIALVGAVAIWVSHPAIFIIAGTGTALLLVGFYQRQKDKILQNLPIFSLWVVSFIGFYWFTIRNTSENEALQSSWSETHNAFMPLIPLSLSDLRWFFDSFFLLFERPLGIHLTGIAALAFLSGCASLWLKNREKLLLLISPILVTLLASGFYFYPFKGRVLLFLVPCFLLIIAEGTQHIYEKTRPKAKLVGIAFIALLFSYPFYYVASNLKEPDLQPNPEYQRLREEIKPVLQYVSENRQGADTIYLYYAAQYAFSYYADRYGFDFNTSNAVWNKPPKDWFTPAIPSYPPDLIIGNYSRDDWRIFEEEIQQLRGKQRVWVIFSHVSDRRSPLDEEDMYIYLLNRSGKQLDSFRSTEAAVYLYDFS